MDSIYQPESFPYVSAKFNFVDYFSHFEELLTETFFQQNETEDRKDADPDNKSSQIASLMRITEAECDILESKCRLSFLDSAYDTQTTQVAECGSADAACRLPLSDSDVEKQTAKEEGKVEWKAIPNVGSKYLATLVFQKGVISDAVGKKHILRVAELRKNHLPYFERSEVPEPVFSLPPKEIVLTLRIYNPFLYDRGFKMRPPLHTQDFLVLGSQNLAALRDKIICLNDSCLVGDNISTSSTSDRVPIKELIPSGMFFIEDTFYCDLRDPLSKDYGEWIEKWVSENPERQLGPFQHKSMEDIMFEDLEIRFGLPYVYLHLGSCEHLISFIDARFMTTEDPQDLSAYPIVENKLRKPQYCLSCDLHLSKWIVENDKIPYNPAFLCDTCFQQFHFRDGEKIGSFEYYPYPEMPLPPLD